MRSAPSAFFPAAAAYSSSSEPAAGLPDMRMPRNTSGQEMLSTESGETFIRASDASMITSAVSSAVTFPMHSTPDCIISRNCPERPDTRYTFSL